MKTLFFAALLFASGWAWAQDSRPEPRQVTLAPLEPLNANIWAPPCGRYFQRTWQDVVPDGEETLVAFSIEGSNKGNFFLVKRNWLTTVVDPTKKAPTATLVPKLGRYDPLPFHWVIRLNEEEEKEARPCLPPPEHDPRTI